MNIDVELMEKISQNKRICKKLMNHMTETVDIYKNAKLVGSPKVIAKIKLSKLVDKLEQEIKLRNESISGFCELEREQKKYFNQLREKIKKI